MLLEGRHAAEDAAGVQEARRTPFQGFLDAGTGLVHQCAHVLEDRPCKFGLAGDVGIDAGIVLRHRRASVAIDGLFCRRR